MQTLLLLNLPAPSAIPRVETGVVQFGDDWPGVFIRGDDCFRFAQSIRGLIYRLKDDESIEAGMYAAHLSGLIDLLESSDARNWGGNQEKPDE